MKRQVCTRLIAALCGIAVALPSAAFAYSVCGTLTFFDSRTDRDDAVGSKLLKSTEDTDRPMRWVVVTLREENGYCRDGYGSCGETDDTVWGTARSANDGTFCVSGVSSWADVYYTADYENYIGRVLDDSGNLPRVYSQTSYDIGGDITKHWSLTCPGRHNGICPSDPGIVSAQYPLEEAYANILATIADVDAWTAWSELTANGHSNDFTAHYPEDAGTECSTSMRSWGYDDFCVTLGNHHQNHLIVHELAHNIFRRKINYSGQVSQCSSYGWTFASNEMCATAEGWAEFYTGAIYFNPSAALPWIRFYREWTLEGDTDDGNTYDEACASLNSSPETALANVARFFWDLFDSTNLHESASEDDSRTYLADLTNAWDQFPSTVAEGCLTSSCDDNRENKEDFWYAEPDGRNVWDYRYHYNFFMGAGEDALEEAYLNCLQAQDSL